MKKYVVRLEAGERVALQEIVRTGKRAALTIRHANILLAVDESDAGGQAVGRSGGAGFWCCGSLD